MSNTFDDGDFESLARFYFSETSGKAWHAADLQGLEDSFHNVFENGAAVAFGIVGMAEAIRKNAPHVKRCASCGYDPARDGDHPNTDYDNTIWPCENGLFCGACADQLGECDAE